MEGDHAQTGKPSMRGFQGSPIFFLSSTSVLYLRVSGPVGLILISE